MKNQFELLAQAIIAKYQKELSIYQVNATRLRLLEEMRKELVSLKDTMQALGISTVEEPMIQKLDNEL